MLEIKNVKVYDLLESMQASGYSFSKGGFLKYDDNGFLDSIKRCERLSCMPSGSGHQNFLKGIRVSFDVKYPQYWSMEAQRYNFFDIVSSASKMHTILKMNVRDHVNKYVANGVIDNIERLVLFYNDMNEAYEKGDKELIYLKEARYNTYTGRSYRDNAYSGCTPEEFRYDCFMRILSNCPMGLELVMRVSTNYLQLQTIYRQRNSHVLKEDWGAFCRFIEDLPFSSLITGKDRLT